MSKDYDRRRSYLIVPVLQGHCTGFEHFPDLLDTLWKQLPTIAKVTPAKLFALPVNHLSVSQSDADLVSKSFHVPCLFVAKERESIKPAPVDR